MDEEMIRLPGKIRIACVGDSLAAAPDYPDALENLLGEEYEVGRFGVNSTTVQKNGKKETGDGRGWYGFHPQYRQSRDFQPDIVLLMLGVNDAKRAGENPGWVTNWTQNSPVAFERDLCELVTAYQALDSHPLVVMATAPAGWATDGSWGVDPTVIADEVVPLQRRIAAKTGCQLVDFFALTRQRGKALIGGDGLHPTAEGYRQLAEQFCDAIRQAVFVKVEKN
ncbi:MAG: GDSL-type esterase/lipase family protein [Acutalibacteraceae bacterium]|jgi:lysophospholipase L1-like esterase